MGRSLVIIVHSRYIIDLTICGIDNPDVRLNHSHNDPVTCFGHNLELKRRALLNSRSDAHKCAILLVGLG